MRHRVETGDVFEAGEQKVLTDLYIEAKYPRAVIPPTSDGIENLRGDYRNSVIEYFPMYRNNDFKVVKFTTHRCCITIAVTNM